ncbi:MAG: aerobic carbon-monoxide dehydrogenase medium subunit, partial [Mycobacterium sp.]|nr:aerobic carbon-monoxide dehydrogenase medium subunit [Mycobacterium sp.]
HRGRLTLSPMQEPGPFEYERATSVDHAVGLLDRLGDGARVVAGGHSLLPMMKLRIANPEYLVDINDLAPELGYVITDPTLVRIGAMTRHRELLESDTLAAVCPIFRDAERVIADPVVRNRGTLGGSLCQADPAEDLSTVCAVLDAVCLARGPSGEREIPIDGFPAGPYETTLAHNELLIEVRIPVRHNTSSAYQKVERRVGDWAVTAAGSALTLDGDAIAAARVGLTAVTPDPAALTELAAALVGKPATEEVFAEAGRMAGQACDPVSDVRGTADYKRHLASELTIRTLRMAAERVRSVL